MNCWINVGDDTFPLATRVKGTLTMEDLRLLRLGVYMLQRELDIISSVREGNSLISFCTGLGRAFIHDFSAFFL